MILFTAWLHLCKWALHFLELQYFKLTWNLGFMSISSYVLKQKHMYVYLKIISLMWKFDWALVGIC